MKTIGETLVARLRERGVDTVFGIPGVHTVELYRGLAASGIRHVTPRHEQGAGFMADGYARASGKPGVAFVITGPGLTNTLTAMAQARADSVPMLVVSGVNRLPTLGKGLGHLHELPDQRALARQVALVSERIENAHGLDVALKLAFAPFASGRPGPTHIELPLDVAAWPYDCVETSEQPDKRSAPIAVQIAQAAEALDGAERPIILAGGGCRYAADLLRTLAEKLDAPVVQTANARGVLHAHPLGVPACPDLKSVRSLIENADAVLALGTELGPTDYDQFDTGSLAVMSNLIRVDISADQLARRPAKLKIHSDVASAMTQLLSALSDRRNNGAGAERAARTRKTAWQEIGPAYRHMSNMLAAARKAVPNALMIGDSTQPIYAGNLYYDHDRAGGWFNAATGFGALGYAIPAAIGAACALPEAPVICIAGDGGAQFSLPEIMAAKDENLPITFVIWNNDGYGEIETSMEAAGVTVVGCDPTPPQFADIAKACGLPYAKCPNDPTAFGKALRAAEAIVGPRMIEISISE